jgi:hypothetical protein
MPFAAINLDIAFSHGPVAGSKVTVYFPQTFKPAEAFALCIFLHGRTLPGVSFEKHIAAAVAQIASSPTNTVLVAPRFGDATTDGNFAHTDEFSAFVGELQTALPPALAEGGMLPADADRIATYAATKAPIALVAFSGGWSPLNAILKGLLAIDQTCDLTKATRCRDRVIAIELLDSIYDSLSSSGPVAWLKQRRRETALVSIYGRHTGDNAKASNIALIKKLEKAGPVLVPETWDDLKGLPAGSVAFFEVLTLHLSIPRDGPPAEPVAAFLSLLGDRLSTFAAS